MYFSAAAPDRFTLDDSFAGAEQINRNTSGLTPRTQAIDPTKKTLVLIVDGQSQWGNVAPSLYVPTNSAAIDQFNIYDGASYPPIGPMLGQLYKVMAPYGPGNVGLHVADNFVTNGVYDRVILVPIAIGGTTIAMHAAGPLKVRKTVAMARLASRGITPSTPGVKFAYLIGIGETDNGLFTPQASFAAGLNTVFTTLRDAGFVGPMYVCVETWAGGVTSAPIRAAQMSVIDNVNVFSGGDLDTLGATYRQPVDNLHWIDAGLLVGGNLVYNTMMASGKL